MNTTAKWQTAAYVQSLERTRARIEAPKRQPLSPAAIASYRHVIGGVVPQEDADA